MDIKLQFGMRLRYLREQKGWTQETLSFESGVHKNYISDLELGRRNPTLEVINRLSDALDITLSELMKGLKTFK